MDKQEYFYQFLKPISKELTLVARELENSIYTSPRTMLTHARIFVENILQQVIKIEKLPDGPRKNLKDRLDLLDENGYLTEEVRDALHYVRQAGNQAAHSTRRFRYSEALLSWEAVYNIVKWYVEVYGPVSVNVPDYQDPAPRKEKLYDISELEARLQGLEELLRSSLTVDEKDDNEIVDLEESIRDVNPGLTTIRKISYRGEQLEIPYFLRDAFLLPQRFTKSETFLIRLGAEQQARIMSELPSDLEGFHKHVKRFNEQNDENFFHELKQYIEEEKVRRHIKNTRPDELFFFYKEKHIVVTEQLSKIKLTANEFSGIPSLLRQLNEAQIERVGELPQELVILAKYTNVGIGTVERLFEQIKGKQKVQIS